MESLDRKERELHAALAGVGTDYTRAADLDAQLATVRNDKDDVELEWMAVAEQLEEA